MGFLAPAFLAGLIALAVPVLIHLTHRERREVVVFPSLMFLRKIPFKSTRKQRLRHLLLFAMRCLALLLLVIAFARPLLGRRANAGAAADRGAREVVILLDQSYSMGYGNRWERAMDAAMSAVAGLTPADRASVILFDDRARRLTEPTSDAAALRTALSAVRPGSGGTRYSPAVRLARGILDESERPRRQAVLITDFQRSGWNLQDDVRFPIGTTVDHVDLSSESTSNVVITGVELRRDASENRERTIIAARLANGGSDTVRGHEVALDVDGRRIGAQRVTIPPNGSAVATFAAIPVPDAGARATIHAAADSLAADNVFHLVLEQPRPIRVLIVDPPGGSARGIYLRRALAIGTAPAFDVDVTTVDRLSASTIENRDVVILNDAGAPSSDAARRLATFVNGGGGLIVVSGERGATANWPSALRELLPAAVGATVDRMGTRGATLGTLDRTHPALRLFSTPRSGDFSSARVYRYRRAEPLETAAVMARFDDGAPALIGRSVGEGRVLVWTSTFDGIWSDLPVQPVFLPFVHEIVKHAGAWTEERPWAVAGQAADVSRQAATVLGSSPADAPGPTERELVAVAPSGQRTAVRAGAAGYVIEPLEQGFHEIRPLDGRTRASRPLAVNLDIAESELARVDAEELVAAMQAADTTEAALASNEAMLTPAERERRQAAWWYLLAGALLLLAAETVLSNRLSQGVTTTPAIRSNP